MPHTPTSKNIVYGNITAGGNVHIGDVNYVVETALKHSILFLRITRKTENEYTLQFSVKSRHSTADRLGQAGEPLLHEAVTVAVSTEVFDALARFQAFRRQIDTQTRYKGLHLPDMMSVQAAEERLARQVHQTFFSGDIGQVCADFIQLLEEKRIEDLLLVVSAEDEAIVNLPFEMVLPLLFPPKLGQEKKSLTVSNFGLVRTRIPSPEAFQLQGSHATAAPLKMLFITALPENLSERDKQLQIEEEQARLIRAVGALEANAQPQMVIEFLENASLAELDNALAARQHDIVHISGHGDYDVQSKKGVLFLEDENGDEQQVSGADLGETLRRHACVKVLILSACETAIAGSEGGVAEQVAAYGLPGIVAMRFAVTDEGAKIFTTELYTKLARGMALTSALAYAREALHADIVKRREQAPEVLHIAEWFTPVVYQNQALGSLVDRMQPYHLPAQFYPQGSFLKTGHSRLIGEGFIGRKRYLIQLRRAFREGKHVCLHGLGGLGKTTLAEAFAHHYAAHENGTVIAFRNGNQINEAHILQTLSKRFAKIHPDLAEEMQEAIDNPETDVFQKLNLLISNYLHGRRTILLFDNMEDVQTDSGGELQQQIGNEELRAFLRHFCLHAPVDCHLLFTTRYALADLADVVMQIPIDKLGYAEQYRLLNYSDTLRGKIAFAHREEVYRRLNGHPRAYEYLGSLLKKDPTFGWEQVARSEEQVVENLLLAKVYARLSEREQALFQMVAVFLGRTPLAALAAVSGETEADLLPVLLALQNWSLCVVENDHHFDTHRLTRAWMAQHITPAAQVKAWALLAGQYFEKQPTWDDDELALAYYELAEAWEDFARIAFRLEKEYLRIGLNERVLALNQAVLARNIDDRTNSLAQNNIGFRYHRTGDYAHALPAFEQSLALCRKIGDRAGEGTTLNNISQIYQAKGDYDTALGYLEQSLTIRQQIGDRAGEGMTLNNISQIYQAKGDYDTALRYLEQSLSIRQQIGDRAGEGTTLNNLAGIARAKGDYDTALRYLEQSLTIAQQIGDRKGEGVTLNNLSQIYKGKGDYDTALRYLEQSLTIRQKIGDRKGEGTTLNNISQIYKAKGDYDTALRYLEQSLSIMQQIGDRAGESVTLNNIGTIHQARGNYDEALRYAQMDLAICQQIGNIAGLAATLNNMGAIYLNQQNDIKNATIAFLQSYSINQKLGSPNMQYPAAYLQTIIERIGQEQFHAIVAELNQA